MSTSPGTLKTKLLLRALFLARRWLCRLTHLKAEISFCVDGSDLFVSYLLKGVQRGTYLDIGANHPFNSSTTVALRQRGWRGINVDLNEDLIRLHEAFREGDRSVAACLSDRAETITIQEFEDHSVATGDPETAKKHMDVFKPGRTSTHEARTVAALLADLSIDPRSIDFISIDVEGMDFRILQSIDLSVTRPKLLVIEDFSFRYEDFADHPVVYHMRRNGYVLYSYVNGNMYFVEAKYASTARHFRNFRFTQPDS